MYVVFDSFGVLCGPYHFASTIAWVNWKWIVKRGTKEECTEYIRDNQGKTPS